MPSAVLPNIVQSPQTFDSRTSIRCMRTVAAHNNAAIHAVTSGAIPPFLRTFPTLSPHRTTQYRVNLTPVWCYPTDVLIRLYTIILPIPRPQGKTNLTHTIRFTHPGSGKFSAHRKRPVYRLELTCTASGQKQARPITQRVFSTAARNATRKKMCIHRMIPAVSFNAHQCRAKLSRCSCSDFSRSGGPVSLVKHQVVDSYDVRRLDSILYCYKGSYFGAKCA